MKRKRGRPKVAVKARFKSISLPEETWADLFALAIKRKTTIGKIANEFCLTGIRNHQPDHNVPPYPPPAPWVREEEDFE